ncbi:hypothetical protein GCM10011575_25740 [Microlunatus endophyticus]|uniref:Helicase ATP-binding domain-containing protein n=2 Tax=Microlunatus endophyticus TaxID=1716077 RepID=A0A917SBH1_9ACTN|nr:hypothetical protein GCM10011575_25740 [Microlunatus endophyticus]
MTLRKHQRLAMEALDRAWSEGRRRAWVVLPPGAGKTLLGVETAHLLGLPTVVLSPNTAIQNQWVDASAQAGLEAGDDRDLATALSSLTYQSLAVFDAAAEDDAPLIEQLHDNGKELVRRLQHAGPLLLVLDECHHLLEVWGRLLAELLAMLPQARVLGLTATPPAAMTAGEAELVEELFGAVVFEASIPAVVREGDLAPFAELVWLTEPTAAESTWLAESAERFTELVTQLTDPAFGTTPFLVWLDRRFVTRSGGSSWDGLMRSEPELADAALRLHHAGLLAMPEGAVLVEQHRRDPTSQDWVLLIDDWVTGCLRRAAGNDHVLGAIRAALPSVGQVLTRNGIRAGRSPVDRVLARSESKTVATAAIVAQERLALGERLRLLVLTDHERASATLPADLDGVLDEQSGSAYAVLEALLTDNDLEADDALLVTASTIAGSRDTLTRLAQTVPDVELKIDDGPGFCLLTGPWSSRAWVPHVTRFFEAGGCHVLVGTRGLLGEGWDAQRVTGVVDLTAATTPTAVVQTRGRALRIDPAAPDKVALNWTVVCVAEGHPRGDNDWQRLVRKHTGFFGVDESGVVVDGVAHIDPAFSPYAPPSRADFDTINARMAVRADNREEVRERWRVGQPYDDVAGRTVRVRPGPGQRLGTANAAAEVVIRESAIEIRHPTPAPWFARMVVPSLVVLVIGVLAGVLTHGWSLFALIALPLAYAARVRAQGAEGRRVVAAATEQPSVARIASALADALHEAGLVRRAADALVVSMESDGEYRARLDGVTESESELFARALEELLAPIAEPRYVLPRWVVTTRERTWRELARIGAGKSIVPDGVVWHSVPSVLGTNAARARLFAQAWDHWIGGGDAIYTGSPEGAGVLAAQRGSDPFDVSTVIRREWR